MARCLATSRAHGHIHSRSWQLKAPTSTSLNCKPQQHTQQRRQSINHLAQAEKPSSSSGAPTTATEAESSSSTGAPATPAPSSPAPATSSSQAPISLLSSAEQQSAAFYLLSITSLAFGAVALAAPDLLLTLALGADAATPLAATFTRIAGATMAISAAVEYSLKDAVTAGHLKSATYQRLLVAVIAKSSLYLTAFLLSPEQWNPVLFSIYPTAALASVAVNVATLRTAFQQSGAASVPAGLAGLASLSMPKTSAGWVYSVFIVLYLATVAACYAPEVIFTGQSMTQAALLLKHTWAPGFVLAAAACWVLGDAADRGRLGASTFRRLNLGLAAVEGGYSALFGLSILEGLAVADGSSWSNLAGSVGICVYCLYQYAANDKH